jgi:hypothetical protein
MCSISSVGRCGNAMDWGTACCNRSGTDSEAINERSCSMWRQIGGDPDAR